MKTAEVSARAKQAGETRAVEAWAEPCVWTERMLAALRNGVRGGKWFSLMDKVYSRANLGNAWRKVKANGGAAGVDHQSVEAFELHLDTNLKALEESLREGQYRPQAIRRVMIPKAGSQEKRPLGISTVRDRVVQTAVKDVLEPIYDVGLHEQSYGFRPGLGCKDALRRVDQLLKEGYTWVVDADIKSYFDTIPWTKLLDRVKAKVSDGRVLELVEAFLKQGILEGMKEWTPEEGTPQGSVVSPLLSNLYLDPYDHAMAGAGYQTVRYADDSVTLCRSEEEAHRALEKMRGWMTDAGLTLHPAKTKIVDATQKGGFDFLGYHFERGYRWPREKSLRKFRDTIRAKTRRTNGQSLTMIIADINRTARGWYEYFKHSAKSTFLRQDEWIRGRVRSVLRKRAGRKGISRCRKDHQTWTIDFFRVQGLFSLAGAHVLSCQSPCG
jgi:RNA-directed DNA polymerase